MYRALLMRVVVARQTLLAGLVALVVRLCVSCVPSGFVVNSVRDRERKSCYSSGLQLPTVAIATHHWRHHYQQWTTSGVADTTHSSTQTLHADHALTTTDPLDLVTGNH